MSGVRQGCPARPLFFFPAGDLFFGAGGSFVALSGTQERELRDFFGSNGTSECAKCLLVGRFYFRCRLKLLLFMIAV